MAILRWCAVLALVMLVPAPAVAQAWGDPAALTLVRRAAARRSAIEADPALTRWRARARGVVLFLSQLGDAAGAARLAKADELVVEVYWQSPGPGKQQIVAWRDRAWLPTDIRYHRDHLGIVTNDFGPLIRLGEGDEVRDIPHPLGPAATSWYEFALADSLSLGQAGRTLIVHRVLVRPRDPMRPGVIGTLFLEAASGTLVRFRFGFTPASYRDPAIEDISVVLENALLDGRHWLPWRQEIEIRRRAGVMDFPVRGVIRAEWELEDHSVGAEVAPVATAGPTIGGLRAPGGPAAAWSETLEERLGRRAAVVEPLERAALLQEIRALAGGSLPLPGPPARLAAGRVSDLLRVNRVEGLRVGIGGSLRLAGGAVLQPWLAYATASRRLGGQVELMAAVGTSGEVAAGVARRVVDLAGDPPISGPLNSILAQEFGVDRGDWVDHASLWIRSRWRFEDGVVLMTRLALEEWRNLAVQATPRRGAYRDNPPLGAGRQGTVQVALLRAEQPGARLRGSWRSMLEVGTGTGGYARLDGQVVVATSAGPGELSGHLALGIALGRLPPARSFALGGWGSLPGEPYRAFGGTRAGLARLEYLLPVPVPEIPLGSLATTGGEWHLGPFAAAGLAGGGGTGGPGLPWGDSGGLRPIVGVAIEGFWRLLRAEVGVALRSGRVGFSADIASPWWGIL